MNTNFRNTIVGLAVLAIVAVPAISFAKEASSRGNMGLHLGTFLKSNHENRTNPVNEWVHDLRARHVVNGKLTAVSGTTLSVQSKKNVTYTVSTTPTTKFYGKGFTLISISDLTIGDRIQILGTVSSTSATAEIVHSISKKK